jgi:hypothetical protein
VPLRVKHVKQPHGHQLGHRYGGHHIRAAPLIVAKLIHLARRHKGLYSFVSAYIHQPHMRQRRCPSIQRVLRCGQCLLRGLSTTTHVASLLEK